MPFVQRNDDIVSVPTSLANITSVYCVEKLGQKVNSVVLAFHLLHVIALVVVLVVPVPVAEISDLSRACVSPALVAKCASTHLRDPGKLSFLAKRRSMLYENVHRSM